MISYCLQGYRYLESSYVWRSWEDNGRGLYRYTLPIVKALTTPFFVEYSEYSTKLQEKSDQMYERFFDDYIQKAEKNAVLHAVGSHWNFGESAGLLNINDKKVLLVHQVLNIISELTL
jgi:hypothetical protein